MRSIFSILLIGISAIACKKFVQVSPPTDQLATNSVFNNDLSVTAAQLSIYTKMSGESYNMAYSCGLLSDELTSYATDPFTVQYYTNSLQALNSPGPWVSGYNYIYQANAIIAGLQNNAHVSPIAAKQLTGESKFIRAFWYFYLVNLYGDIPLVLTTDYNLNRSVARIPQGQVYQQMVTDLKDAQAVLNNNYVDIDDSTNSTERVRPTKSVAEALLARVYLYMKKYDSAEAMANLVIENPLYSLCPNISAATGEPYVFQKNSPEAIWQLATPVPQNYFTSDGEFFILNSIPSTYGGGNSNTISPQLMNSFEPNDQRQTQWIGIYTAPTVPAITFPFPYKYQSRDIAVTADNPSAATEYVMVLRLAEQYLIRAEARAQQGKLTDAISDLNAIRSRGGNTIAPYSGSLSDQTAVLAAIMHERRVELFSEWGNRWFDLNRTNQIDAVMGGPTGVCQAKGGSWVSTDKFLPIPQTEILNDANIKQNPGY